MTIKKEQAIPYRHYVSQFYLKSFTINGRLSLFSRKALYKPLIRCESVGKICGEPDFFAFDGVDEFLKNVNFKKKQKDKTLLTKDILENLISKLEREVSIIIKKIIKNNSINTLDTTEQSLLLQWLSWMYVANPKTKTMLRKRDPEGFNTSACGGFISLHNKAMKHFRARTWVLGATQQPLLTSDYPVAVTPPINFVMDFTALSRAMIYFAITSNLLLIGFPNEERALKGWTIPNAWSNKITFQANYAIWANSDKYLIGQKPTDIEFFIKQIFIKNLISLLKNKSLS